LNRVWLAAALTASALLMSAQVALAARIYNNLPAKVRVKGSATIVLAANTRSESISWGPAPVTVYATYSGYNGGKILCDFPFNNGMSFGAKHVVGGNYIVIGNKGRQMSCVLCNSSHKVIWDANAGEAPEQMWAALANHRADPYC
jgi:hypothetical protein